MKAFKVTFQILAVDAHGASEAVAFALGVEATDHWQAVRRASEALANWTGGDGELPPAPEAFQPFLGREATA